MTDGLIAFAFDNKPQDVERFRNAPYWRERFGTVGYASTPIAPMAAAAVLRYGRRRLCKARVAEVTLAGKTQGR